MRQSLCLLLALFLLPAAAHGAAQRQQPNLTAGIRALNNEDYRAAVKQLERAIVADPRNADGYHQLGRAHAALGHYGAALKYFGIALELKPNHRAALLGRGEVELKAGDLAAAEATLATLGAKCEQACEQYVRLRRAVDRVEAGHAGRRE